MRQLHPATMLVAFLPKLKDAFMALVPALAVTAVSGKRDTSELIVAGIGILGGFGAIATYLTTRYWIEEAHLKCKSGWLFRRDRQIPLEHIHNVNLRQNLLERAFRVVTVEIETAAGAGPELKLQVVRADEAESLRGELLSARSGPAAEVANPQSEPIYRVPSADLWLGAITENHFAHLLLAIVPFFGVGTMAAIPTFETIHRAIPEPLLMQLAVLAGLLMALAGWVAGAVSYAMRYARFQVRAEPGAYRIAYGLMTRVQHSIRAARVEHLEISSTLWQTWIRRVAIHVGTAGTFGEQGLTAPIALMLPEAQSSSAMRALLPDRSWDDLEWQRFPLFYLWISAFRSLLVLALVSLPIVLLSWVVQANAPEKGALFAAIMQAGFGFAVLSFLAGSLENALSFRRSGFAANRDLVAVRHGFFRRRTTFMPLDRVEVVEIVQPIFWRRRGLVTVTLTGMKHALTLPMVSAATAEGLAQRVRERASIRQSSRKLSGLTPAPHFVP